MKYCPLMVFKDDAFKCLNTRCEWWICGKGCAIRHIALKMEEMVQDSLIGASYEGNK